MKKIYIAIVFLSAFFIGSTTITAQYRRYDRKAAIEKEKQDTRKKKTTTKKKTTSKKTTTKTTTSKTEEPFHFDITFNDMQVLLDMQGAINAAQQKKVDEWLKKQEGNFLEEINRQLGTKHTSFGTAQKDFFKKYEKNVLGVEDRAHSIGYSYVKKANNLDSEQETHTGELGLLLEWESVRNKCGSSNQFRVECHLFDEVVRGKQLGRTSTSQVTQLKSTVMTDFSEKEYESARNRSWAQGMYKIINDGSLTNEMANKRVAHYRQKGLQDKIFFMTTYLTQYNNRGLSHILNPTISKYTPPNFWDPGTLLEMGKRKAPVPDVKALVFLPNYINDRVKECERNRPIGPRGIRLGPDCSGTRNGLEKIRDEVIDEHLENTEYGLTQKLNRIRNGYVKGNGGGKIGGLEALSYKNYVLDKGGPNRFYQLDNGGWVYRSNSPRKSINGGGSFSEDTLNDDGFYYYIHDDESGRWHELLLPAKGISTTSDPYLAVAFWKGMKGIARYALPIEDTVILVNGENFDGNKVSRTEAGLWLIVGSVPGGKLLQPVAKITKGGLKIVSKMVKVGNKTIKLTYKTVNGVIQFGGKSRFKEIVGTVAGEEAHHIIPWAQRYEGIVQKAAEWGFHMNSKVNGIPLKKFFQGIGGIHGNHPKYNDYVLKRFDQWEQLNPNYDGKKAIDFLEKELIPELLDLIEQAKKSGKNLNDYFKNL
nr:AHH domain-containing protein [Allomuricauda sp.]